MKTLPKRTYLEELEMLAVAAQALLDRVDGMTTEEFSRGGERTEREFLRKISSGGERTEREFLRKKLDDCRKAKALSLGEVAR